MLAGMTEFTFSFSSWLVLTPSPPLPGTVNAEGPGQEEPREPTAAGMVRHYSQLVVQSSQFTEQRFLKSLNS
jgi:hypothetical protein